jgi:hypothetical protein
MADWFVSQKVAASGVGTSLSVAFKTIAEAITAASSNDTIYIYGGGVYLESISTNKQLTVIGVGSVILDGTHTKNYGIEYTATKLTLTVKNVEIKNFLIYAVYVHGHYQAGTNFEKCNIFGSIFYGTNQNIFSSKGCLIVGNITATEDNNKTYLFNLYNNTIIGNIKITACNNAINFLKNIIEGDIDFNNNTVDLNLVLNNFHSSRIRFDSGESFVSISSVLEMESKYLADMGVSFKGDCSTTLFFDTEFNNLFKNNYSLKESNPVVLGAFNYSNNIICKETGSSGNCNIYDISADDYSLGLFGGITNVGAIDNTNQKLYRSSTGANNWGVFVANTEFERTRIVKNWLGFGGLIGSVGQTSEDPSDWANHYNVDILVKWSATLSKAALLAETSIPFVKLRYRPNETNYYVDNSGTLVGDGDADYQALVSSADTDAEGTAGGGALVPQRIVAKSIVVIIILRDL